jgi:hypothetical protein
MKAEQDPLASHIFISRRHYRNVNDRKSGKRREMTARLSFNTCLRAWLSWQPRRMGTPDGSSYEAVKHRSGAVRCIALVRPCDNTERRFADDCSRIFRLALLR